jgi:hypothetical protein
MTEQDQADQAEPEAGHEPELDDEPGQEPNADEHDYPGEDYPGDDAATDTNEAGWQEPQGGPPGSFTPQ